LDIDQFINFWQRTSGAEHANKDLFLLELCTILDVPRPRGTVGDTEIDEYVFEADAKIEDENAQQRNRRIDLHKRGCFILEAKQGSQPGRRKRGTARRGTEGWDIAMNDAYGQALGYVSGVETPPPFLIVTDIGYCFDLYACFNGSGHYTAYPNKRKNRLFLTDLKQHKELLRAIWLNPAALDPEVISERVTREVAEPLADLAEALERAGHLPELVARFLLRCVFTMFAEDVGLLPGKIFTKGLENQWIPAPKKFQDGVEALWEAMNEGKKFFILGKLLQFNGGLFANPKALPLSREQLKTLHQAASKDWRDVQPAIFGTLIERALNSAERHRLGAYFTPTDYVERLLIPTLEEPLQREWQLVVVRVRELVPPNEAAQTKNVRAARDHVELFRQRLCTITVLDPACGSGNFLYLALNLFKRLESEVLSLLQVLGADQMTLGAQQSVTPAQFLGIETRRESKEIAELVLWIGYLQWHYKMYGAERNPPEPVLKDYRNIELRDALLEWSSIKPALDANGKPILRWDGVTMKKHPTTGEDIPDDAARVPATVYLGPRQASWPKADYIVGNPPFIGNKRMRARLGDGYVDALRLAYPDVSEAADLVMYWWHRAGELTRTGHLRSFGLITTNSITQAYNRSVVEQHCCASPNPLALRFAIPDHPWVEAGVAVRIAMTVGDLDPRPGCAWTITALAHEADDPVPRELLFESRIGRINSDLTIGADAGSAVPLHANEGLSFMGVTLGNKGFVSREGDANWNRRSAYLKTFIIGKDLNRKAVPKRVIDLTGLSEHEAQRRAPALFQHVLLKVKPQRDQQRRKAYRENWWVFVEARSGMRRALAGLKQYIATCRTSTHRVFTFVDQGTVPESTVVAIALDDPYFLGVLSSRIHLSWALRAGSRLGVGNDPRYNHSLIFEQFPFPIVSAGVRKRIGQVATKLDEHRKDCLSEHPDLTITDMYNVLEKSRRGAALDEDERAVHQNGLVALLDRLHNELDQAVFSAFGWEITLSDDEILTNLIALNQQRSLEEASGRIRYLRPDFQSAPASVRDSKPATSVPSTERLPMEWPATLPDQVAAVRDLIMASAGALTANDVANTFEGATTGGVLPALQTLEVLGIATSSEGNHPQWKGLARTSGNRPMRISSRPPHGDRTGTD
jgi:hypothetical protein